MNDKPTLPGAIHCDHLETFENAYDIEYLVEPPLFEQTREPHEARTGGTRERDEVAFLSTQERNVKEYDSPI